MIYRKLLLRTGRTLLVLISDRTALGRWRILCFFFSQLQHKNVFNLLIDKQFAILNDFTGHEVNDRNNAFQEQS